MPPSPVPGAPAWNRATFGAVYDREMCRQGILPQLGNVKRSEIASSAGCSKASASGITREVDAARVDVGRVDWTFHLDLFSPVEKSHKLGAARSPTQALSR